MPQWMEPPRIWERPAKKSDEKSSEVQRATSRIVIKPGGAEPVTKSDPPAETTPSVAEVLESPREITETPSEVDRSDSTTGPNPSDADVSVKPEEATRRSSQEVTCARLEESEQEWELPDWFKRKQMESMARHAQRRGGMRFGMWGFPLETWTPSSAC